MPFINSNEYTEVKEIVNTFHPNLLKDNEDYSSLIDFAVQYLSLVTNISSYSEQSISEETPSTTTIKHRIILARLIIYLLKNTVSTSQINSVRILNIQVSIRQTGNNPYWDAFVEEVYRMGYEMNTPPQWEARVIREYDPEDYINTPNSMPEDF